MSEAHCKRGRGRDPNLEDFGASSFLAAWREASDQMHLPLPLERLKNTGLNNLLVLGTEEQEGKCNTFTVACFLVQTSRSIVNRGCVSRIPLPAVPTNWKKQDGT